MFFKYRVRTEVYFKFCSLRLLMQLCVVCLCMCVDVHVCVMHSLLGGGYLVDAAGCRCGVRVRVAAALFHTARYCVVVLP